MAKQGGEVQGLQGREVQGPQGREVLAKQGGEVQGLQGREVQGPQPVAQGREVHGEVLGDISCSVSFLRFSYHTICHIIHRLSREDFHLSVLAL